ncbi:MAG: sensor histidine kinase, partial [Anaerolineales bacterium]
MKWIIPKTIKNRLRINYWLLVFANLIFGGVLFYTWLSKNWLMTLGLGLLLVVGFNFWVIRLFSRSIERPIVELEDEIAHISPVKNPSLPQISSEVEEMEKIRQDVRSLLAEKDQKMGELRQFVANASHELRTPLTTIKLRVEALRDGAIHDESVSEKFLHEVEREVDHLSAVVGDLLDLSRIESGNVGEAHVAVDLSNIVEEICDVFEIRAKDLGVNLISEIEANLPLILGIEGQLRRLVYNLVDNAIKYNRPGGSVTVQLALDASGYGLQLRVSDTGFGIPTDYLPHIFERFYRAEATRPRYASARGSGLGLAIVKAIADNHGAEIRVESEM